MIKKFNPDIVIVLVKCESRLFIIKIYYITINVNIH